MEIKDMICIVCPIGCSIKVNIEGGTVAGVSGNRCKRGEEYAAAECTNPVRTLTTTVRVEEGHIKMCPVRTNNPVPKGLQRDCMQVINNCKLQAPVKAGQLIIKNILGTGADVITTSDIRKAGKVYG